MPGHEPPPVFPLDYVLFGYSGDPKRLTEVDRAALSQLIPCPHCGHGPHLFEEWGNRWGSYDWVICCSSSHCRAQVRIVSDGYTDQEGKRTRLTQLCHKWNRRYKPGPA